MTKYEVYTTVEGEERRHEVIGAWPLQIEYFILKPLLTPPETNDGISPLPRYLVSFSNEGWREDGGVICKRYA